MTTRVARESSESLKGLDRTVAEAKHATMKLLGERALALGFSQESLAKEMRERFPLRKSFNGANVRGHFEAEKPQRETIRRYGEILGLNPDQMQIILDGGLNAQRLRHWEGEVYRYLGVSRSDFKPGLVAAIKAVFKDPAKRKKILTETALSRQDFQREFRSVPPTLHAFAAAIVPFLDLRTYLRGRGAGSLFMIYSEALELYQDPDKARAFVDACAAILRLDGIDTREMYDYLNDLLRSVQRSASRGRKTS